MRFLTVKNFIRISLLVIFITQVAGNVAAMTLPSNELIFEDVLTSLEKRVVDNPAVMADRYDLINDRLDFLIDNIAKRRLVMSSFMETAQILDVVKDKLEKIAYQVSGSGSEYEYKVAMLIDRCDDFIKILLDKQISGSGSFKETPSIEERIVIDDIATQRTTYDIFLEESELLLEVIDYNTKTQTFDDISKLVVSGLAFLHSLISKMDPNTNNSREQEEEIQSIMAKIRDLFLDDSNREGNGVFGIYGRELLIARGLTDPSVVNILIDKSRVTSEAGTRLEFTQKNSDYGKLLKETKQASQADYELYSGDVRYSNTERKFIGKVSVLFETVATIKKESPLDYGRIVPQLNSLEELLKSEIYSMHLDTLGYAYHVLGHTKETLPLGKEFLGDDPSNHIRDIDVLIIKCNDMIKLIGREINSASERKPSCREIFFEQMRF